MLEADYIESGLADAVTIALRSILLTEDQQAAKGRPKRTTFKRKR